MEKIKEDLSLEKLYALLSQTTLEFIKMIEDRRDGLIIKNKGREIETIQFHIDKKKELPKNIDQ